MNEAMYLNPAVQENIATLTARGFRFVEPETGWLACGNEGKGRLASIETVVAAITDAAAGAAGTAAAAGPRTTAAAGDLAGRKVVITGGPTLEPIDAVRFISNRSSGKMADALVRVAARRGASTVLVTGPTAIAPPAGTRVVRVETAAEMQEAVEREWKDADCIVMAAAVSDFRPAEVARGKIRRGGELKLNLVPTADILAGLATGKDRKLAVGFAMECENEIEGGKRKLKDKNLDLVVVNNPLRKETGFGSDTNSGYLVDRQGRVEEIPLMSKLEMADKIFDAISARLGDRP
jgi:phosphopantothenoylcysteine decarboxylase/phosphopantothenate--cysteine ligase